jgi:Tfp pilus assembly protein PilO
VTRGKKTHSRRKQQYAFAVLTALIVAAVAVFYLLFYRPVHSEHASLEETIARLQTEIIQRGEMLVRLEDAEHRLANAREARAAFLSSSLFSREEGYAALIPDLVAMARRSGIEIPGAQHQYLIADEPMFGVYPVQILEPVRGDYASIRRYIQEIEASPRFFLIDSIAMQRAGEGDSDALDVELAMSTFFAAYGDE